MRREAEYFRTVHDLNPVGPLHGWACLSLILLAGSLSAQTDIPPFGPAYIQEEVATIAITMDPDSAAELLFGEVEYAATNPFPATVQFISTSVDTLIDTIAVQLGATPRCSPRRRASRLTSMPSSRGRSMPTSKSSMSTPTRTTPPCSGRA